MTADAPEPPNNFRKARSWKTPKPGDSISPPQRAMSMPPPPPGWVQETVSAYNLPWADLRRWLTEVFKKYNAQFNEKQTLLEDYFYFWAPRHLSEGEKVIIDTKLRLKNKKDEEWRKDRRARTPDEGTQARDDLIF